MEADVDGCEEDQVGEMDGQVEGMEAEEGEVEVHVCEVQVEVVEEAVEVEVGDERAEVEAHEEAAEVEVVDEGAEVEAHEEAAEVEVGDANGLNRDSVEGPRLVDVDLNVASDVEVEAMSESDDSSRGKFENRAHHLTELSDDEWHSEELLTLQENCLLSTKNYL